MVFKNPWTLSVPLLTVRLSVKIISRDKFLRIFSLQIEAIVYTTMPG